MPVNDIVYQKGTNGVLYAATDVGVYRYDPLTNSWSCYSNNLPVVLANRLKINYCSNKLFVGTFGRGTWESSLLPTDDIVISGNVNWSIPTAVTGTVSIPAGSSLTISNTVSFSPGGRIVVEPGALLDVNGGTLTNRCGDQWGGIVVLGNAFQAQTAANQGRLTLRNNALVEHAKVAVYLGDPDNPGKGGGIVMADYSVFENNDQDVYFDVYGTKNNSFFHHCDFKLGDAYRGAAYGNRVTPELGQGPCLYRL
jgi:hypothetical protein